MGNMAKKNITLTSFSKEKTGKSKKFYKALVNHIRRISLELLNVFVNHDWLFGLIGFVNKYVNLIGFVFMVYPANEKYALKYVYRRRLPAVRWNPWPCGILWQNGKIGLMFCVSSTNGQFSDPRNAKNLERLVERMEKLRLLLDAKRKTFAGIVPGVLAKKKILHKALEADLTAEAVEQGIDKVLKLEFLKADTPVIVLGGKGFIGRRVISCLDENIRHSIDSQDGQDASDWPELDGQRAVVVNITINNALENYLEAIPCGSVVLNEVYPEPKPEVLEKLRQKGCKCYHVVGIKGKAFPPFPKAYKGAIPCCSAWPSKKMKVVVKLLN